MSEKKYKVFMVSKDAHKYSFSCWAFNEEEAREKANERIISNNWEIYKYEIDGVVVL